MSIYIVFFCVLLFATSLFDAKPQLGNLIGFSFVAVVGAALELARRVSQNDTVQGILHIMFYVLQFALGLGWGLFSAYVMTEHSIGWIFFIVLLTCFILSSVHSLVYVPDLRFHVLYQIALLGPSSYVAFVLIGGQVGNTIGGFALGYLAFMVFTGYFLFRQFWRTVADQQKIEAIVSSTPALLCWLDAKLQIHGVSQSFADFFRSSADELRGTSLAKHDCDALVAFASDYMSRGKTNDAASMMVNVRDRTFYFRAKQYIPGEEMVLVGLDVTDQQIAQEELEVKHDQIVSSAKFVSKGILLETLSRYFQRLSKFSGEMNEEKIQKFDEMSLALRNLTQQNDVADYVVVEEILRPIELFFENEAEEVKARFNVSYDALGAKCKGNLSDLTLAVFNLVRNSFDAIRDTELKLVQIVSEIKGKDVVVSVHDTGVGVDEVFEEVIFEPTFTTKGGAHLGTGLSLSRDIVRDSGGDITYRRTNEGTCFEIRLPIHTT